MKDKDKPKLWWRIRGLDKMESRFGKNKPLEKFIRERLKTEKTVRILELGFGEGKCLLDLRKLFPDKRVELYGINYKKEGGMYRRSDFAKNAKIHKLPIPKITLLPKPFFYDAGNGLHFESKFFDAIVSQLAFPYVGDKAKLLEEFWRVLKFKGKAFLNIDAYEQNYPDFLQINKETPRFVIYENDKMIKLSKYLTKFKEKGFNIKFKKKKDRALRFVLLEKNTHKPLKLSLKYDGESSINLTKFHKEKNLEGIWWGIRSVFKTI